jgi:D-alanyl-D-alanine carboxypeptidase
MTIHWFILSMLAATGDSRVDAVVTAFDEPGCPRLFAMLSESFQKAVCADQWPGFCQRVGRMDALVSRGQRGGWLSYDAQTPTGTVAFDLAFSPDGRISGLRVRPGSQKDTTTPATLKDELSEVKLARHLPGLAAMLVRNGKINETAAVGERKLGDVTPVGPDDIWHLGSDTKAMTATLVAMFVDEKKLSWESPLPQLFPQWKDLAPGFKSVTLEMLLGHRGGLPAETVPDDRFRRLAAAPDQHLARSEWVHDILREPPENPGAFRYSNAGYVAAGVILEQVSGTSWEVLIQKRLFGPLGMTSCGFGAPAHEGKVDQPWAHDCAGNICKPIAPGPTSDNPPALGPAGTVHCSLADWAKFVSMHVRGERGEKTLVSPESMKRLHAPQAGGKYSMGWGVVSRDWAGGTAWNHNGSNGMFFATVWVAPAKDLFILSATNRGGDEAQKALDDVTGYLIKRYAQ